MSIAEKLAAGSRVANEDIVAAVREAAKLLHGRKQRAEDLKETTAENNAAIQEMEHKILVDLMNEAGLDKVGVPSEGNQPAFDAKLTAYYHANIAADWEAARREGAFDWLEENGHGDLIKVTVAVSFGRREMEKARELEAKLHELGFVPQLSKGVPWGTLTAWLKEQVEKHRTQPPLDILGATVGQIVKLVTRKE